MLLDALRDGAILDAFHAESDRGAILVATSLLDTTLEKILRAVFVGGFENACSHTTVRRERSHRGSTLRSRWDGSKANTAKQLHRMREIRNVCAHSLETVTVNTQQVRDLTNAMNDASSGDAELFVPKELRGQQTAPAV